MFNNTYELSLNKGYVAHWGVLEAVRELIQNGLDSDSPFIYEFKEGVLTLKSEFTVLKPQTLLLGTTSKAGNKDAIGSFGEGYKIAMLVLTREEYIVEIDNGEKRWTPEFEYSRKYDEELLVIKETKLPYKNKGLTFRVIGLSRQDEEGIRESCLHMQDFIGEVLTTSYGDILLEKPGKLYVGGLFICETELKYGYNIHPQHIALERDRQTVSSFDLKLITKNMWIETGRYDAMACMIEEGIEDVDYVKYGTTELVKEACYRLFREKHPGAVVAENQKQLNELVERGMERVVVVGGTFYSQVSAHSQYASETKIIIETPTERLQRFFSKYRGNMRTEAIVAFKQLIQESGKWRSK